MKKWVGYHDTVLYLSSKEAKDICHLGQKGKQCPWLEQYPCPHGEYRCLRVFSKENGGIKERLTSEGEDWDKRTCNWIKTVFTEWIELIGIG